MVKKQEPEANPRFTGLKRFIIHGIPMIRTIDG